MTNPKTLPNPVFEIGQIVMTANVLRAVPIKHLNQGLSRHIAGDWGDVCPIDADANELALVAGSRLISVYHDNTGVEFRVVTEADRSATTVLLPSDY